MIDLHCHILPGIDDGAADPDVSLAMARTYVDAGFTYVVATPHAHAEVMAKGFVRTVREDAGLLNCLLQQRGVDLKVLPGMELAMESQLPELLSAGAALTLGGKNYLLVETPFSRLPLNWQKLVFNLGTQGVTVLLAHPERCEQVIKNPGILGEMIRAGARLQVNWDSFAGAYGRQTAQLARKMARDGLIHCLATDSHDSDKRHPGRVVDLIPDLSHIIGAGNLRRLSFENPLRALRGLPMLEMDQAAAPVQRKSWWKCFTA